MAAFKPCSVALLVLAALSIASAQEGVDRPSVYRWIDNQGLSISHSRLSRQLFLAGEPPTDSVTFEKWAGKVLEDFEGVTGGLLLWRGYGTLKALTLARMCASHRLTDLEDRYCRLAATTWDPEDSLTGILTKEVTQLEKESLYWDIADQNVPRRQVLAGLRQWVAQHPAEANAETKDTCSVLESMIAEDEKRPNLTEVQLKALTPERKAAELVYRLRGVHQVNSGMPSFERFADYRFLPTFEPPSREATQLVHLQLSAVPALLEALTDRPFTRTLRDFFQEPTRLVRVQDAAVDILEAIACRSFGPKSDFEDDRRIADEAQQARAWYEEVKAKGEAAVLAEIIETREKFTARAAYRLAEIDPAQADKSIRIAMDRFGYLADGLKQFLSKPPR